MTDAIHDANGNLNEEPPVNEGAVEVTDVVAEEVTTDAPTTVETAEEKFIDPDELPKELLPHFKRMQASFTRRMQKLSSEKEKVAQYDQLLANPEVGLKLLADKVGMRLVKPNSALSDDVTEDTEGTETERWVRRIIKKELEASSKPILEEQAKLKVAQTITYLDKTYPDWTLYEDVMSEMVQRHPSLRDDVDTLYDVSKSAVVKAETLKKQSQKAPSVITKASSGGRTTVAPKKGVNLDEAFQIAKKQLGLT